MRQTALSGLLVLLLSVSQASDAWWNADSLACSIPAAVTRSPEEFAAYLAEHFPDETERVRALYSWIGSTISYDPDKIEASGKFENIGDFVLYTLQTKQAVCQGYAEIFTAVCTRMGIPAITVHGYTRVDGQLRADIGHAWNIAKVAGKWSLFDPTWGSGYLDEGRYHKSFSTFYFMPLPDSLIKTHMPFDPVWQLRDHPVTHDQFLDGGNKGSVYYNYADSLELSYVSDEIGRAERTLERAEAAHAGRKEIIKIYRKYYGYVTNMKCNSEITRFNEASFTLRNAIDRFNEFRELHNLHSPDLQKVRLTLDSASDLVRQARAQAQSVTSCQSLSSQEIRRLLQFIGELETAVHVSYRDL